MSGLFGILNACQADDILRFLGEASREMSHQPWYEANHWTASDVPLGVGRIGIGKFNQEPQPVVDPNGDFLLWMCGEIYKTQDLRAKLEKKDIRPLDTSPLELVAGAYRAYGPGFACELEGAFFIVVYDLNRKKFYLTNDRFGLYPHYYHISNGQLVFAPEVKAILCAPGVRREMDLAAACEYFRFQQILGRKTFHEGISLFPYGSLAQFDLATAEWSTQRYWDWDKVPYHPEVTFNQAVEEAGNLLQQAVVRLSEGNANPGVFLSGGLDSRTLIGFIPTGSTPPVTATFGSRNSRDVIYAQKIARAVGSRHYWFDYPDGRWVLENVDLHLQLTEGFHNWAHMHGITALKSMRSLVDYNLTGWDGGTVMGHSDHINAIYNHPVDEWTVALQTYQQFIQAYTWPGLTDAEERLLFTPDFGKRAIGLAFESLLGEFSRFWNFRQEYAAEYFYVVNHCWRLTQNMVTVTRSAIEVRFPFWDYALIDFMYSLAPIIRRDQLMYRTIITRRLPHLANIPGDKKEYLPTVNPLRHNLHKVSVWTRKKMGVFPERTQLYADYENYLRHELRPWAESILFDQKTASRGIFNMPFLRSLMDRHLSGHENWIMGKIAPLITFEMVMRAYFD